MQFNEKQHVKSLPDFKKFISVRAEDVSQENEGSGTIMLENVAYEITGWNDHPEHCALFSFRGYKKVKISNVALRLGTSYETYQTILIYDCEEVEIENVFISGTCGSFHIRTFNCARISISGVEISGERYLGGEICGGGIYIANGSDDTPLKPILKDLRISNCYIHGYTVNDGEWRNQDAILIESPGDGYLSDCRIEDWLLVAGDSAIDVGHRNESKEYKNHIFRIERNVVKNCTYTKNPGKADKSNGLLWCNNLFIGNFHDDYHEGYAVHLVHNTFAIEGKNSADWIYELDSFKGPTWFRNNLIYCPRKTLDCFLDQNGDLPIDKWFGIHSDNNVICLGEKPKKWITGVWIGEKTINPSLDAWMSAGNDNNSLFDFKVKENYFISDSYVPRQPMGGCRDYLYQKDLKLRVNSDFDGNIREDFPTIGAFEKKKNKRETLMSTRSALPQNNIKSAGTLFEDFETLADWTVGGSSGRTQESNVTQFLTGTKSLKLSVYNGSVFSAKVISTYPSQFKTMRLGVYLHTAIATFNSVDLQFSSTTDFSKYMTVKFRPNHVSMGNWHYLVACPSDFTVYNDESWNNLMIRLRVVLNSGTSQTVQVSVDELQTEMRYIPSCGVLFDDGLETVYTEAYPRMTALGLKGTVFVIQDLVGITGYMTLVQLQTLYAAGWLICNHSKTHPGAGMVGMSQAAVQAEFESCKDYLIANGMPKGAYYCAYPLGAYDDTVIAGAVAAGMITGRTTTTGTTELYPQQYTPLGNLFTLNCLTVTNTISLATTLATYRKALDKGSPFFLLFHRLESPADTTTKWLPADFQSVIEDLVARRVKCVTYGEWYRRLENPRYLSIPL